MASDQCNSCLAQDTGLEEAHALGKQTRPVEEKISNLLVKESFKGFINFFVL